MASKRDADQMELHTHDNSAMLNNGGDGTKKSKTMHNPPHDRRDSLDKKKKHSSFPKDPSFNRDGCISDDSEGDFDTKSNLQVGDHNEHSLQDSISDHDPDVSMLCGSSNDGTEVTETCHKSNETLPDFDSILKVADDDGQLLQDSISDHSDDSMFCGSSNDGTEVTETCHKSNETEPDFDSILKVADDDRHSLPDSISDHVPDVSMLCGSSNDGTEVTETCHKSNETEPDQNPKETSIGEKDTIRLIYVDGMCHSIIYRGNNLLNSIFRQNPWGIIGDVNAQYDTLFELVSLRQRTINYKTLEKVCKFKDETKRDDYENLKKKRISALRLMSVHVRKLKRWIAEFADSFKFIFEDVQQKTLVKKAETFNELTKQIFGHLVQNEDLKKFSHGKLLDINAIEAQYEYLRSYFENIGKKLKEELKKIAPPLSEKLNQY